MLFMLNTSSEVARVPRWRSWAGILRYRQVALKYVY